MCSDQNTEESHAPPGKTGGGRAEKQLQSKKAKYTVKNIKYEVKKAKYAKYIVKKGQMCR